MSANGYLTPAELSSIGNGMELRTDAAASWLETVAAAHRDGVNIESPGMASAYRPWSMQLDMRVHPALYGINPNMHALPGLPSRHGWGTCKDVSFGAPNDWMIANGPARGWNRPAETMALNDLNHWEFTPGTATAGVSETPLTTTTGPPPLTQEQVDEMASTTGAAIIRNFDTEAIALVYPEGSIVVLSPTMDITSAITGHAKVFHIAPDNAAETTPQRQYVQLSKAQWDAWQFAATFRK